MRKGKKANAPTFLGTLFSILLLVGSVSGLFVAYGSYQRSIHPIRYEKTVERYAADYGVETALIYAMIKSESNFAPDAVSVDDACGLMQLLPSTLDWLQKLTPEKENFCRQDLFDPEINIRYGVFFLSVLFREFSNTKTVIAAYHAGINCVRGWLKNPDYSDDGMTLKQIPFEDTKQYVALVMQRQRAYQHLYHFS